ncbi:MAG: hypothetical protein HC899_25250 [Leptolyngbyaceae cyanobacterium SM1_4_3]|nr:hypothetical protein [Leptolyngbyaceae cyanobacterium SM1_4_3]NJN90460.1 hypothetical protein [Leptolyngbyaceae cyanobacterium SL_5_14]
MNSKYWVIDVNQKQRLVFREPQRDIYQVEQGLEMGMRSPLLHLRM